jgi:2-oxoglutarate dehydrogenase E2 component (dihydrolipoamide succinyltransferase)
MPVVSIAVPDLGEQISRVRVVQWLVAVGATLTADQPVVVVSTDKIDVEITAPVAGTLHAVLADAGAWVAVGAVIGLVDG